MKLKCPKCLMEEKVAAKAAGHDLQPIHQKLSIVCNAAPVAPRDGDPCCCGADWIPEAK